MLNPNKPWLDENGSVLSDDDLRKVKTNWRAKDWEAYLDATIESPQQELLVSNQQGIEAMADHANQTYYDLLDCEDHPHLKREVRSALKRLTVREREVLHGIFWAGKSQREVAKITGLTKSSVTTYLERALKKLGNHFIERLVAPEELEHLDQGGRQDFSQEPMGREKRIV